MVGSVLLGLAAVVVWGASSGVHVSSGLVYTKWTADAKVLTGPEVGYKPSLTPLSAGDMATVKAAHDSTLNGGFVVNITFTPHGKSLLAGLTRANVAACPGDAATDTNANCPERYLTSWVGLTQADIDRWDDLSFAAKVSQPYGSGGKLLANAITLDEIDGGSLQIAEGFTQKQAQDLVAAIEPKSTPSSAVGSAIAGWLGGLAFLMFIAGVALVTRRLFRPQGEVMDPPPPLPLPPEST